MKMTKTISIALALSTLVAIAPMSAMADRHDDRRGWHGDIRHFHERDIGRWRSGHWYHGYHDGHLGWWWIVAPGLWYLYSQAVYPYPDPYTPPVVVVQPPAPSQAPAPSVGPPPPAQYWYYCESAKGYYPYVPSCPGGWKMVPATPADAPNQ